MNIPHEIQVAEADARKLAEWFGGHMTHLAAIAIAAERGPVGQALLAAADTLLPEDEKLIAEVIRGLAALRRSPQAATAAPVHLLGDHGAACGREPSIREVTDPAQVTCRDCRDITRQPAPADMRTIRTALEEAAQYRRDGSTGEHQDCKPDAPCDDHAIDESIARMYDDLGARLSTTAPAAPTTAVSEPAGVPEGDQPAPDGDGAQGAPEGDGAAEPALGLPVGA